MCKISYMILRAMQLLLKCCSAITSVREIDKNKDSFFKDQRCDRIIVIIPNAIKFKNFEGLNLFVSFVVVCEYDHYLTTKKVVKS